MEFNAIMQALVKDLAEQMRPMVAEMVKQELAKTDGDIPLQNLAASIDLGQLAEYIGHTQLATIAEHLSDTQLVTVGQNVSVSELAGELTDGQLNDIAGDIDLADLAGEFDLEKVADNIDLDEKLKEFLDNNTFTIRT